MKYGFDNEKYLRIQSEHIKERIAQFGDKLYLELGGKLFDDYHASRVLPGFQPDSKLRMLQQLSDCAEIVIVISANDIEKNKVRADYGITYDMDVLRLRTEFQNRGFLVSSVVITHFNGQASAKAYKAKLKKMGIKAYYHYTIEGYPNNVALIDSEEGYGKNDYVQTSRPLVIVTAPGPGSGKMAVCLSQLYHEHKKGIAAGYAKFETFPVWNLPLKHPVNIAYEAATAQRCEYDRSVPLGGLWQDCHQLQQGHRDIPGAERPVRGNLRRESVQVAYRHGREYGGQLHQRRRHLLQGRQR